MSVSNGQYANAETFNSAFMSRTKDTSTTGKLTLEKPGSPKVDDAQADINQLKDDVGNIQSNILAINSRVGNVEDKVNALEIGVYEHSFGIENDIEEPADIEGLLFDAEKCRGAFIEYLIQRITDEVALIEIGQLIAWYQPDLEEWMLAQGLSGGDAGVTFSITAGGQLQYVSSDISGEEVVSKISCRIRNLVG